MSIKKISILGGGSWGTVLANLACQNGGEVNLWMRDKNIAKEINLGKGNTKYLPGYKLEKNLRATTDISIIATSKLIIFCIPSNAFRNVLIKASSFIKSDCYLISATKGIEQEGFKLMSQIIREETNYDKNIGVLSGPNLATEISKGQLTGTVIASNNKRLNEDFIKIYPGTYIPANIETYNDHRMAMSLALAGLKIPGVCIKNPSCVEKSFPDFFERLENIL